MKINKESMILNPKDRVRSRNPRLVIFLKKVVKLKKMAQKMIALINNAPKLIKLLDFSTT